MAMNPEFNHEDPFFRGVERVPLNDEESEGHGYDEYQLDDQILLEAGRRNLRVQVKRAKSRYEQKWAATQRDRPKRTRRSFPAELIESEEQDCQEEAGGQQPQPQGEQPTAQGNQLSHPSANSEHSSSSVAHLNNKSSFLEGSYNKADSITSRHVDKNATEGHSAMKTEARSEDEVDPSLATPESKSAYESPRIEDDVPKTNNTGDSPSDHLDEEVGSSTEVDSESSHSDSEESVTSSDSTTASASGDEEAQPAANSTGVIHELQDVEMPQPATILIVDIQREHAREGDEDVMTSSTVNGDLEDSGLAPEFGARRPTLWKRFRRMFRTWRRIFLRDPF